MNPDLLRKAQLLEMDTDFRCDVATSQALTALITSFLFKLELWARRTPAGGALSDGSCLKMWALGCSG